MHATNGVRTLIIVVSSQMQLDVALHRYSIRYLSTEQQGLVQGSADWPGRWPGLGWRVAAAPALLPDERGIYAGPHHLLRSLRLFSSRRARDPRTSLELPTRH